MWESIAMLLVQALAAYAALGFVFALPFLVRGVARIDPDAMEGTWGFRVLILPGVVALWPLLLLRWASAAPPPEPRDAHRRAAARGGPR